MPGLDSSIIASFSKDLTIGRIRTDIESDFIFAPQYKLLYDLIPDELWEVTVNALKSGSYNPTSLITAEVPKPSGMTRPGSILYPVDRIVYQAISDYLAPILDAQLDGERVYSYRILDPDPNMEMYQPRGATYEKFKNEVRKNSVEGTFTHAIETDIASYFVHLNHHTLENLLTASGIPDGLIRLLVKSMLETWSGRFSYGIPQGIFPSDLLGNFYLSALDTFLASRGTQSIRYVDDLILFFDSDRVARKNLAPLCQFLRGIGLDLNESKSGIVSVENLVYEHTGLDTLFEEARQEIVDELNSEVGYVTYGFQDLWDNTESESDSLADDVELLALYALWDERTNLEGVKRDQLDRFCIGALAHAHSDQAVDVILSELGQRPHMTKVYCNYLATFVNVNSEIRSKLCDFIVADSCTYDWELQWPIAALLSAQSIPPRTINTALGFLGNSQRGHELRSLCALLVGKLGTGPSRANLRLHWDNENSEHVRAAMVLALMFFGTEERNILLTHWGRQSSLYGLIAGAVRKQVYLA